MNINTFIDNTISKVMDQSKWATDSNDVQGRSTVNNYAFAFGPYICMTKGFEKEADELSRNNSVFKFISAAAFFERSISGEHTYQELKQFVKKYIITIDDEFPGSQYEKEREALMNIAKTFLNNLRSQQGAVCAMESTIIDASPIIPYSTILVKPDPATEEKVSYQTMELIDMLEFFIGNLGEEVISYDRLMINLRYWIVSILKNIRYTTILDENEIINIGDKFPTSLMGLLLIDNNSNNKDPDRVNYYYFLATCAAYNIKVSTIKNYLTQMKKVTNVNELMSFAAFESFIVDTASMINTTNVDIDESASLLKSEDEMVMNLLKDQTNDKDYSYIEKNEKREENSNFDFTKLNNYIYSQRYMKFMEYVNNVFTSSLKKAHIVNINPMGDGKVYYELSNNTIACPFQDLRDYSIKVMVMYANSFNIEIVSLKDFS